MPVLEPRPDDRSPRESNRVELLIAIGKYLRDVENDVRFVGEPKDVGWHEMHRTLAALAQSNEISVAGLALIASELGIEVETEQDAHSVG